MMKNNEDFLACVNYYSFSYNVECKVIGRAKLRYWPNAEKESVSKGRVVYEMEFTFMLLLLHVVVKTDFLF